MPRRTVGKKGGNEGSKSGDRETISFDKIGGGNKTVKSKVLGN